MCDYKKGWVQELAFQTWSTLYTGTPFSSKTDGFSIVTSWKSKSGCASNKSGRVFRITCRKTKQLWLMIMFWIKETDQLKEHMLLQPKIWNVMRKWLMQQTRIWRDQELSAKVRATCSKSGIKNFQNVKHRLNWMASQKVQTRRWSVIVRWWRGVMRGIFSIPFYK